MAGTQLDYINRQRIELNLITNEPLENAPPSLAFATVAMGAFRGILVDFLWIRADNLKEQGQFFDAKQLSEWITTLQPRFAEVWLFQAWNMAYNISVAIPISQPEQRWQWVKNGYELLRDKAIVINPKSIQLYQELARIYQHKIGFFSDDLHRYYKLQLAMIMEPLVGGADNQFFEDLIAAPKTLSQLETDPNAATFVNELKNSDKKFEQGAFATNYLKLRKNPTSFNDEAFKVVEEYQGSEVLKKIDFFAKSWELRNVLKLNPEFMQKLNKKFGPVDFDAAHKQYPLDWRVADVHSIYWAELGLERGSKKEYSSYQLNLGRMVTHGLQNLFRYGKLYIYKVPTDENASQAYFTKEKNKMNYDVFIRPDLRMFNAFNKTRLANIEYYQNVSPNSAEALQKGHENFLEGCVLDFYQAGHADYSKKIYRQLQKLYPCDDFKVTHMVFIQKRLKSTVVTLSWIQVKKQIHLMLKEAYFRYAIRDDDQAYAREKFVEEMYEYYRNSARDQDRLRLESIEMEKYFALLDFVNDKEYPAELRNSLLARIKLERPKLAKQLENQEILINQQKQK